MNLEIFNSEFDLPNCSFKMCEKFDLRIRQD